MRCGLFGKLPTKRDFIAISAPRDFLAVWEPWLQGGISSSRMKLASGWQDVFLQAPIWRFWLGAEICGGGAVIGAIMPSVDGVGRYFPLTVFAKADAGEHLAPPELDLHETWLSAAEDLLLSALSEGTTFEALNEAFTRFQPPPAGEPPAGPTGGFFRSRDGTLVAPVQPGALRDVLGDLRQLDHGRAYGTATYWWTEGGGGFAPQVLVGRRMPDPYLFTGMLTGRFDEAL